MGENYFTGDEVELLPIILEMLENNPLICYIDLLYEESSWWAQRYYEMNADERDEDRSSEESGSIHSVGKFEWTDVEIELVGKIEHWYDFNNTRVEEVVKWGMLGALFGRLSWQEQTGCLQKISTC
jgi:hypothetical protein